MLYLRHPHSYRAKKWISNIIGTQKNIRDVVAITRRKPRRTIDHDKITRSVMYLRQHLLTQTCWDTQI